MPELPRFSSLTLVLTEQCNLRCAYCYVPKTGRVMAESVALRAADFLLDRAPVGRELTLRTPFPNEGAARAARRGEAVPATGRP